MRLKRIASPFVSQLLTGSRTRDVRRTWAEVKRRLRRQPHRVFYFHQVDDPYSHLAAQASVPLLERFDLELSPYLVGPPSDAAAPERQRLIAYSRKDAAAIGPHYGLPFRDPGRQPDAGLVQMACRILAGVRGGAAFATVATRVGGALWSGDAAELEAISREHPPVDSATARAAMGEGGQVRRQLGHYLGATFYYGGEWYWGVDRLHYLERRLADAGVRRPGATQERLVPRPGATDELTAPCESGLVLEFFPSLRSPYSYISMPRTYELARRYSVQLVLRPVLPMVMRGLPVPAAKRLYIALDSKREAEQAGLPFGKICDPVGRPVERGYSLFPWAREQGKAEAFLLSFCRAAFGEGIDTGTKAGLRVVVERAGLRWQDACNQLDSEDWRSELEANREALSEMGLWGVPSFRLRGPAGEPDLCTWGQDRIWLIEEEIRRRLA